MDSKLSNQLTEVMLGFTVLSDKKKKKTSNHLCSSVLAGLKGTNADFLKEQIALRH